MQRLRYKENRNAVSERRQEQTSAMLYRKILICGSSGFGILIFFISNKRYVGKLYCEKQISEFGDADL